MLLEVLISIIIFSVAILGLVGLQAAAVKNVSDARQRAVAAFYTNQLIGYMWADSRSNLGSYAHRPSGSTCGNFSGSSSSNTTVTNWLSAIQGELDDLATDQQQISVNTTTNVVTVTMCWKRRDETTYRVFSATAQIQG